MEISFYGSPARVSMPHHEISRSVSDVMGKLFPDAAKKIKTVWLKDSDSSFTINEGDEENEGEYIVEISFSDSLAGFTYNLIGAVGFILDGNNWMSNIPLDPLEHKTNNISVGDIWYEVYTGVPDSVKAVF